MNTPAVKAIEILSREEIDSLRRIRPWMGAWGIVHAWGVIFGAMALAAWFPNPATWILAVAVVGARQLGLAILMHDGAHRLLFRNHGRNDALTQWLTAFPVKADIRTYRPYHLEHHRHTQTAGDPDLVLSAPFPIAPASFRRKILRDLLGLTGLKLLFGSLRRRRKSPGGAPKNRLNFAPGGNAGFLISNAALFGILWAAGRPSFYFLFWLLPLLTVFQLVTRVRSIAEHGVLPAHPDDFNNTRTTRAGLLARAFIAPYCVNYHIEHHLFTFVPWYNLPKAHALLLAKGYGPRMEIGESYAAVLRKAVTANRTAPPASA